jgi:phage portal protein BeeE
VRTLRTQADVIKKYITDRTTGDNQHQPLILAEGGEFFQVSMNAEQAQVLESRAFSVGDIARLFGSVVAPAADREEHELGHRHRADVDRRNPLYLLYLAPLLAKIEAKINLKLFATEDSTIHWMRVLEPNTTVGNTVKQNAVERNARHQSSIACEKA